MNAPAVIENAVADFFDALDHERWNQIAGQLHPEVELADEITREWLRGADRVAAYLRAQKGVVTEVVTHLTSLSCHWITGDLGLTTFLAEQHYQLDGASRHETLTGLTLFSFADEGPQLLLLHLGGRGTDEAIGEPAELLPRPVATAEHAENLAEAVRRRRRAAGLSLRTLGQRAGLSASSISQIERGVTDPSIGSLRRLANALEVAVSELLNEASEVAHSEHRIVRAANRRHIDVPASNVELELLTPALVGRTLQAAIVTLRTNSATEEQAGSDRFLFVLDGRMRLTYEGRHLELAPGDSITVETGATYQVHAADAKQLRYLAVLMHHVPRSPRIGDSRAPFDTILAPGSASDPPRCSEVERAP